ncbi:hypothetical protein [Streptomyces sp. NPDC048349]|uniref:hypothetical protein n=1 Tax=Streptomyces sp. NPDC048349 TaxID=3155486 RepID=UPI003449D92D
MKRRKVALGVVLGAVGALVLVVVAGLLATLGTDGGGGTKDRESAPAATPRAGTDSPRAPASQAPASQASPGPDPGPAGDVRITSCGVDPTTHWPSAKLTITNRSSKTSTYLVGVEFLGASGVRLAEGAALSNDLAPGQRAEATAGALDQVRERVTCRVTKVNRFAS